MKHKEGFTLVELAIVLVIIGLLIGGILAAQSMISTTKINAQVRQIGQFDAGVMNFKTNFNFLPGDAPAFGGDGDGVIDCANNGHAINVFDIEHATFWNNVFPNEFLGSTNSGFGVNAITSGPNKNVPLAKSGSPGAFFVTSAVGVPGTQYPDLENPRNYYFMLDGRQIQQTAPYYLFANNAGGITSGNAAMKPIDLFALDSKMDDGIGVTGNVLSGGIDAFQVLGVAALGTCSNGSGTYQVQNAGYECTPLIRIGGSVGNPQ